MKILFLVNELLNDSEITRHLQNLSNSLLSYIDIELYLIYGCGNANDKFNNSRIQLINNNNFLHSNRSFRNFFKALTYLRNFCSENNIDIIHSHSYYSANIAYHTSYKSNVKTIQTIHELINTPGTVKQFNAHKYIAINEQIYNYIIDHNITQKENLKLIKYKVMIDVEKTAFQTLDLYKECLIR